MTRKNKSENQKAKWENSIPIIIPTVVWHDWNYSYRTSLYEKILDDLKRNFSKYIQHYLLEFNKPATTNYKEE